MKIVIFGNSGSGKSTLAKAYSKKLGMASLDLDTIAWKSDQATVREEMSRCVEKLNAFMNSEQRWVIEGCYADLIAHSASHATTMVFLNPGIDACVSNCNSRPWEVHKYQSKEEQDQNLKMLVDWVRQYGDRTDELSLLEHRKLFDSFKGQKLELKSNEETRMHMLKIQG